MLGNRPNIGIGADIDDSVAFVAPRPNHPVALFELGDTGADRHDAPDGAIPGHKWELGPRVARILQPLVNPGINRQLGARTNPAGLSGHEDLVGARVRNREFVEFDGELFGHDHAQTL